MPISLQFFLGFLDGFLPNVEVTKMSSHILHGWFESFDRWLSGFRRYCTVMVLMRAIQLAVSTHQVTTVLAVDSLLVIVLFTIVFHGVLSSGLVLTCRSTAKKRKVLCEWVNIAVWNEIHLATGRTFQVVWSKCSREEWLSTYRSPLTSTVPYLKYHLLEVVYIRLSIQQPVQTLYGRLRSLLSWSMNSTCAQ